MYKNLTIFLKFWSTSGYWNFQNALDFYHLKFQISLVGATYSQQKEKAAQEPQQMLSMYIATAVI
jgi:hypothetical protein